MVKAERMQTAVDATMMATDIADYLVDRGVPFREAHAITGKAVRAATEQKLSLAEMPLEAYQAIGPFEADVYRVFDPLMSIQKRNAVGGTSLQSVKNQIAKCRRNLQT
jgi:argininosuccinate lyase